MARNIGATLSLKDGNFFANVKSAMSETSKLKQTLTDATKSTDKFGKGFKASSGLATKAIAGIGAVAVGVSGMALSFGKEYTSAVNSISAQTGLAKSELEGLDGVMKNIYSANYGDNFQDIADAISIVKQTTKEIDPSGIEQMTTDALALRDTFGFEILESVRSANMMMEQFEITGTEAFNLITQGVQKGLDKNGDFLDTLNEYSVHYKQIGIDAEGMLNSLINGTASGTFSVDKLGDAVKEFGIRVKDGTADDAFKTLGLSVDATKKAFVTGGKAGADAFKQVTEKLFAMKDSVKQNELGVKMFGTMWEDLGIEGVKALTNVEGAADRTYDAMSQLKDVKYDDLGSAFEGIGRTLTTGLLLPISDRLLPVVNDFAQNLNASFASGELSGYVDALGGKIVSVADKVAAAAPTIIGFAENIGSVAGFVIDNWNLIGPVVAGVGSAILTYKAAVTAANVVEGIRNGLIAFSAVMTGTQAAAFAPLTTATIAQIAATQALNIVTQAWGVAVTFATSKIGIIVAIVGIAITAFVFFWNKFEGFRNFWISAWDVIKNVVSAAWSGIKTVFSAIASGVGAVFNAAQATVSQKLSNIKNAYTAHGGGVKGVVFATIEGVKGYYTTGLTFIDNLTGGKLTEIKNKFESGFDAAKNSVINAFTTIKTKVSGLWEELKSIIKTPHMEVTGTVSVLGYDTPIPKFGLKWYASGGIMTRPTIFGVNGNTLLGGGERGAEAILPLSVLWNKLETFLQPQRALAPATVNHNTITVKVYSNNEDDATLADKVADKILEILDNM